MFVGPIWIGGWVRVPFMGPNLVVCFILVEFYFGYFGWLFLFTSDKFLY